MAPVGLAAYESGGAQGYVCFPTGSSVTAVERQEKKARNGAAVAEPGAAGVRPGRRTNTRGHHASPLESALYVCAHKPRYTCSIYRLKTPGILPVQGGVPVEARGSARIERRKGPGSGPFPHFLREGFFPYFYPSARSATAYFGKSKMMLTRRFSCCPSALVL